MLKRLKQFFSQGFSSPELGAFAYSSVTLLVTLVGIFRERLLASIIGPGAVLDAYVLAHKIPDILYVTTAALFVSTTLLPHLAREKTPEGKHKLMSEMYTIQLVGSTLLAVLFVILTPLVIPLVGPGFSAETISMAQNMSRIILLSPILMGVSNILGLNAQMNKQFILVALSPLLYNLGTVFSIMFGYSYLGYFILPIAILISSLLHMSVQLWTSRITAKLPELTSKINWKRARMIIAHALPRTFTTAVVPITALGIIGIGSRLAEGSVSLLNFAIVIQNVPVTLIGSSMAVAAFPLLVDLAVSGDRHRFSARVAQSFRVMTTLSLPVIALMWVMRHEVVSLLLSSGNFTPEHALTTAKVVGILILGMWAQSIVLLASRIYYAHEKTWSPFFQNCIGMVVSLGFAYIATDVWGPSLTTLAISFVLGWWVNAFIAIGRIVGLYCEKIDVRNMVRGMTGSLLAAIVVFVVATLVHNLVDTWQIVSQSITILAQGFVVGVSGVLAGIGTLTLIGDAEAKMFLGFLRKKFRI